MAIVGFLIGGREPDRRINTTHKRKRHVEIRCSRARGAALALCVAQRAGRARGLGADPAGRIHHSRRPRRRRRHHGAHHPGHRHQAQSDEAADGGDQQGRRRRRRRLPRREDSQGNPHKIVITLSNLFTTPLATGIPFNWKDLTPVAMLALDEFVLWVNAEKPYKTAKEYVDAAKAANGTFKMGGTGSKQEDQIITEAIQKATGAKFIYIPQRGGGAVAVQLVGNHVDSTVNNPNEAVAHWRGGKLRPLCVFDGQAARLQRQDRRRHVLEHIPTCKSQGLDIEYLMLRGIFMTPGATKDQVDYYVDLFKKVRKTPEWKKLMSDGAFNQNFMTGPDYVKWVATEEKRHEELMKAAGWLANNRSIGDRRRNPSAGGCSVPSWELLSMSENIRHAPHRP